ncbi:ATP-dependent DNA ligase [Actinoalloteichus hymeniacidonis]|uniref:DNA ligase (ATP) n=1 Tax=Actinoalloteichus hymeniacidonis TaxID=340345 RepID=A0AAC9N005_9PSEU|nr:ATP-dependent DNA ligase [Actinoalloteichus hymeniacidonis]AOS64890.1 ATP-dependent DNA ligase [Actinoalloteichus hymeniacidonis]MBB5907035.1 ATP-dependent DNA ligase [Actinoalloteichus hymeniacidonis]
MALPLSSPIEPMLASPASELPVGDYLFEPKWDGFRCLVFRAGEEILLQSRTGRSLNRYFPEVLDRLAEALPEDVVLDGELVVARAGRLDFDALGERIHPAQSRVRMLAEATPAEFIAFDILALGSRDLRGEPLSLRRDLLVDFDARVGGSALRLTPATTDPDTALVWFDLFEGAGLDGVVCKLLDGGYTPGRRSMIKIKHERTADCVVAGLRWHAKTPPGTAVGSLLLGLYDDHRVLHHVGVVGAFTAARRRALAEEFDGLRIDRDSDGGVEATEEHPWLGEHASDGRRVPGGESRWRKGSAQWVPLRPERVVEVAYDHTEGAEPARFRHTTRFRRWRPDREPATCRYDQLDEPVRYDVNAVLAGEVRQQPGS